MNDLQIKGFLDKINSGTELQPTGAKVEKANGENFSDFMKASLKETNDMQLKADDAIENLVTGKTDNLHETMVALEKADISFRLMMQIRNKLVEAYQEIQRVNV